MEFPQDLANRVTIGDFIVEAPRGGVLIPGGP